MIDFEKKLMKEAGKTTSTFDDIKNDLKSRLLDYVSLITEPSPKAGKDMFVCPLCGSGTGRHKSGAFHVTGDSWYCHACDNGGDIFTLYAELNNLDTTRDFPQIVDDLCQALGVINEKGFHTPDFYGWDWNDIVQDNQQPDQVENQPDQVENREPTKEDLCQELKNIEQKIRELWEKRSALNNDQWLSNQEELSNIHQDLRNVNQRRQEILYKLSEIQQTETKEEKQMNQSRIDQINKYASQLKGSPAESYLIDRGFTAEIMQKYQLGYDPVKKAVVIPYPGTDYYTKRLIDPKPNQDKYDNLPGSAPTFIIKEGGSNYFFITEGQLDALSMVQVGVKNVIASHYKSKIENLIESGEIKIDGAVIVADRDEPDKNGREPGKELAEGLQKMLKEHNIKSTIEYLPAGYKDSNDLLRDDPSKLKEYLALYWKQMIQMEDLKDDQKNDQENDQIENDESRNVFNVSNYLNNDVFGQDIAYFAQYKDRKTGFVNLDRYLTLYPGVACLGGASSLGKTTFAVNLVDNLLEKGEHVIYFSLEQLPIELVTKSLSRRMYWNDPSSPITNLDIKNGASSEALVKAKKEYSQIAKNYTIIRGDFHYTANKIISIVENYIYLTGVKPVVVIDYLQLIAPPDDFRGTQREIIDENLKAIKDLSKRNELFILLISSFNRASYKEPVSMESFKESGMIEYTCDYIFGLQLSILEDSDFYTTQKARSEKENNNFKKDQMLYQAIRQDQKEVELVALKNRNGTQRFKCFFKYNMKFDAFEPDLNSKYDEEKRFENAVKEFNDYFEKDDFEDPD